ncbi:MAG: RHS repeat-associated core domain-containing protein [Chloroflexi bacterium]|nr:RHS repeat-associated core domain-containing protein [Chloroflexota bacterium]
MSVRLLTDNNATTTKRCNWDPFGVVRLQSGTRTNEYQFAGEQEDGETGLINLGARYYAPEVGRLLSRDDVRGSDDRTQTNNRYTYATNNPITNRDPTGHGVEFDSFEHGRKILDDMRETHDITLSTFKKAQWELDIMQAMFNLDMINVEGNYQPGVLLCNYVVPEVFPTVLRVLCGNYEDVVTNVSRPNDKNRKFCYQVQSSCNYCCNNYPEVVNVNKCLRGCALCAKACSTRRKYRCEGVTSGNTMCWMIAMHVIIGDRPVF